MTNMSESQNTHQRNREGGQPRRRNNNNRNRNNSNRNRNDNRNRTPRTSRPPKPLKLTLWQKILKAIGLFDEDKVRKQQREVTRNTSENKPAREPKTNTRTATNRTSGGNNDQKRSRAPQPVDVDSARLYIGNLSYDASEYDIEDLFKGVGTVKKVELIYNRNTHKSKGYGFVQMLNVDEAKRAVDILHDQPFMGRQLVVNGSKSRRSDDPYGDNDAAETENDQSECAEACGCSDESKD